MKTVYTYCCYVDGHRRHSRRRNTYGRYFVGAKTPKEAEKLLRKKIKFGSIIVFPQANKNDLLAYKEIKKVEMGYIHDNTLNRHVSFLVPARAATDPIKKED